MWTSWTARCEICGKKGHDAKECYQREGGVRRNPEELQRQISRLQSQLQAMGPRWEAEAGMYARDDEGGEVEPDAQCALMAWRGREEMGPRSGGRDGRQEHGRKEHERGHKPDPVAQEKPPARHPQERLACQTSVLLVGAGAMAVEGKQVKTAIIDTGAQSVMLSKGMAEWLGLMAPGRLVEKGMLVMTAEGGEPKWMPCTRTPIELTLLPGGEHKTRIRIKCGISESEDFDVLVGREMVFAVGMSICTWTEKVEFCTSAREASERQQTGGQVGTEEIRAGPRMKLMDTPGKQSDLQQPIRLVELFGGIGGGLAAVVKNGIAVQQWIYVEQAPEVREHHAWRLQAEFPELLSAEVIRDAMGSTLHDVSQVTEAQVASWGQRISRQLGKGISCDAARAGSYAHRLRMYWQNVIPVLKLKEEVEGVKRATGRRVLDILEPGRTPAPVCQKGYSKHYPCNQVGRDRRALPTLVSYVGATGYKWEGGRPGPGLVYDHRKGRWEEPTALERELAMGYGENVTAAPGVSEEERRRALENAMDGYMMRWLVQRMWRETVLSCGHEAEGRVAAPVPQGVWTCKEEEERK
ncbi:unnamed protein product [Closterium sp. NIES-53]